MTEQTMQVETKIPPIAYQNYPVDIYIRIYRDGARYYLEIIAEGQMLRIPINMSPKDLEALNKQLQNAMCAITRDNVQEQKLSVEEFEVQLRILAEAGHYAFKRVFCHHDSLATIQELMALSQNISIQVVSEEFFLPWELIYPFPLDEPLSYNYFWGMNYIISRIIVQDDRSGAFVSPTIWVNTRPKLGVLTYRGLSGVVEKELHFFKKLEGKDKIALFVLRSLNPCQKREEFQEFKGFWNYDFNVAHFACHAVYEDDSPELSFILLSDDFPITLMDMDTYDLKIDSHPLIIMNACETGNLNPLYTSNFAAAFLKYGARGVVATECAVPDAFAADFAEQSYAHLLAGEPLGETLLTTRKYFLEKYNNPSGLLYSMYAPPSIRLVQLGGLNEQ